MVTSFVLNDFDAVTMRLRDNEFNLQPCRLTLSNLDPVPALIKSEAQNFLIPVLRTACERPRIPGLLENLVAMIARSYRDWETDRKSTRLNSSHSAKSRMPSSA